MLNKYLCNYESISSIIEPGNTIVSSATDISFITLSWLFNASLALFWCCFVRKWIRRPGFRGKATLHKSQLKKTINKFQEYFTRRLRVLDYRYGRSPVCRNSCLFKQDFVRYFFPQILHSYAQFLMWRTLKENLNWIIYLLIILPCLLFMADSSTAGIEALSTISTHKWFLSLMLYTDM